jgi:hypothetical protein
LLEFDREQALSAKTGRSKTGYTSRLADIDYAPAQRLNIIAGTRLNENYRDVID